MKRVALLGIGALLALCGWNVLAAPADKRPTSPPATSRPADDSEFTIDEYDFTWTVATVGKTSLEVTKTQDKTLIYLRNREGFSSGSLSLLPKDAEAVGVVLAKTEDYYKILQAKDPGQREFVKAGKCKVLFGTTDKGSFYISVSPDESYSMSSVMIDRKDAKGLAPVLAKATRLVAFVDNRINP